MPIRLWFRLTCRLAAALLFVLAYRGSLLAEAPPALAGKPVAAELGADELSLVKAVEAQRIQAIESFYGAVAAIYGNDRAGGGSGVLYDRAGFALTNHHVVAAAGEEGWAGLADGKLYRWKLIGTDPGGDVAIIRLAGRPEFPTAPLADSETVRVGDWAMAVGNPFVLAEDQRPTVSLGIVSGVHRFQEGSGLNQLVYGNCIQVDSSINPGNSGGPLFNIRGQIIGINGRGSFEERGRVNVGLGYAITANQVKHFIPDLLATKIAQHGTLDAVFGTRAGDCICTSVNLDAPIAKAGLQLADKLVEFEGVAITSANQFTNVVSTYPAGWPAKVVWERNGVRTTAHVRLTALPYEPIVKTPPPEEKPPEEKPAEEKPGEGKPGEEKPAEKGKQPEEKQPSEKAPDKPAADKPAEKKVETPPVPSPMPPSKVAPPPRPQISLANAGAIRHADVNLTLALQIVESWKSSARAAAPAKPPAAFRLQSKLLRDDRPVGTQEMVVAADGKWRVDYELDGKKTIVATDGKIWWSVTPQKGKQAISQAKALRDPHFSQAAALAALLAERPWIAVGKLALDGSDKGNGRLCYRLSCTDAESEELFIWISLFDDQGGPQLTLQKTGVGLDDDEPIPSVVYADLRATEGVTFPWKRTLVAGLAESPLLVCETFACDPAGEKLDSLFQLPTDEKPPTP